MATQFAVDLVFKQKGGKQLDDLARKLNGVSGASNNAANGIRNTGRAAASATANVQRFGIAFRSVLGPLVAVTGAVTFLSRSLSVLGERQADVAALKNGLRGLTTNGTAALDSLLASADKLGKQTLFNDEDFRKGFKLLTSFRTIGVSTYERVATVGADMAQVLGQDVNSVLLQVAKALEAPEVGLTALQRSGTRFTEQQKEQVKAMVAAGKTAEAQQFILAELERQYGGAAKAAGKAGFAGAVDSLGEVFRDFQETVGAVIEPIAVGFVNALTAAFTYMNEAYKGLVKLTKAFAPLGQVLDAVGINWENFSGAAEMAGKVVAVVANDIAYIINQMAQKVAKVLTGLINGVKGFFGGIVDLSASSMDGLVRNVAKGVRAVRQLIAGLINALPPAAVSKFLGFDVGQFATGGLGAIASGIENAPGYIRGVLDRAGNLSFGGGNYEDILGGGGITGGNEKAAGSADKAKEAFDAEAQALDLLDKQFKGLFSTLENFSGWRWEEILGDTSEVAQVSDELQGIANGIGSAFGGLFTDLTDGSKSAADAFKDFAKKIIDTVINMAAELIAKYIAIGIAKSFAGLGGGGGFGVDSTGLAGPSSPFGSFPGLAIGGSFANGGRPPVGRPSLVGEEGPELFVPRTSGTIVPNDELGGGVNSVVNITITDSGTQVDTKKASELGRLVETTVVGVLQRERRPGGMLSR